MLIEVRVLPGKFKIKGIIRKIVSSCGLRTKRIIPHISLYGPSVELRNYHDVAKVLEQIASKYDSLSSLIDGYDHSESANGHVIALRIVPSKELENFRKKICQKLGRVAPSTEEWDKVGEPFWFHITLLLKMSDRLFERAWATINQPAFKDDKGFRIPKPYLLLDGIRITCVNNRRKIQFEHDLMQKRLLNRSEALSRSEWQKTLDIFRRQKGLEILAQRKEVSSGIFLISDLHLDHQNIIKYCARPFANVCEMNQVLVNNWNNTVDRNDKVYYLGDMTFGRGSNSTNYWLSKLNGSIIYIGGNHERFVSSMKELEIITYKKSKFLLVHDPNKLPIVWDGWVIHGHKHNNDVYEYPFINGETKTINVCAEMINYVPLDMEQLFRLKFDKIKRMDTLSSKPIYF